MNFIDNFLNRITMYRLVLYYLIALVAMAFVLSVLGVLPYAPMTLLLATLYLVAVCWIANRVFAYIFGVSANVESVYITALILALILTPSQTTNYGPYLLFAGWAGVWAMASKYIFAIKKKHFLNPAAFSVALMAFTIAKSASWWVGTTAMLPLVLIGGLLVVRKLRRFDLVLSFLVAALLMGMSPKTMILGTPLLFFSFIMITEPLTTPPKRWLRIVYGALVGVLFAPAVHIGSVYSTPELALLVGNIFSYFVSPKQKLMLVLKEKIQTARDTFDLIFTPNQKLQFQAGQYMEWTLGHRRPDSRGNRRYFTITSSPTENNIRMGVKFYPESSTFKKSLLGMRAGDGIVASQLAGEFTLPKDPKRKIVFIAGGIGITPFRSMIQYLLDRHESRPITMIYANKSNADAVYRDVFDRAQLELGITTIYHEGLLTMENIAAYAPDFKDRMFYLSGPHGMVAAFEHLLADLGIPRSHIKVDFFPGFV